MGRNYVDGRLTEIDAIVRDLVIYLEAGDASWGKDAKTCEHIQKSLLEKVNRIAEWRACCVLEAKTDEKMKEEK